LFPDEQLGQVAELYLNRLIYPPALMKEAALALGSVAGILNFVDHYNVGLDAARNLCHNLSFLADPVISDAGLAVYAALVDTKPPREICARAQTKGLYVGLLRTAMLRAREHFQLRGDWLEADELDDVDRMRFQIEQSLGFIPWLKLSQERIGEKELRGVIQALSFFDMQEAVRLADGYIRENPADIELRLQSVYLDMIRGEHQEAIAQFRKILSEPGCEEDPMLFDMWGICDLAQGDVQSATEHLGTAYKFMNPENFHERGIANNYAWSLMLTEQFERALEVLETALRYSDTIVTVLLNKAYIFKVLSRHEEATAIEEQLIHLAPLDSRTFQNLLLAVTPLEEPPVID